MVCHQYSRGRAGDEFFRFGVILLLCVDLTG